jgi:hypothetical protein
MNFPVIHNRIASPDGRSYLLNGFDSDYLDYGGSLEDGTYTLTINHAYVSGVGAPAADVSFEL